MTRQFKFVDHLSNTCTVVAGTIVLTLSIVSATGNAQTAPKIQEPEYANSFFRSEADGTLIPLERKPVTIGMKTKALGFGGADATYQIQEEHSPVRVKAGTPLNLVVRLEKQDVDPATQVLLYTLKIEKGQRKLLINGVGAFGIHSKSDLATKQSQLTFLKYGQASLKIEPQTPLSPGEYAVVVQSQNPQITAYCFGVDAAN
ncbi:hypothetical protein [Terriglobus roseus]|uniref:Intracellular proteinase inhibitor n=1 Tax=Terriglobus roseus TaxID=392734 RepID=A0A1G7KN48_9BACT|nr:hypothetical protein [Terriglobus roseus]SDF38678.1 hypothetical protein SAMN05444167_2248 [Terriglobus roseus]